MYGVLRHIALAAVGIIFIISSSGVYLTVHHCHSENITDLFFFTLLTEEPCDHHAIDNSDSGCCASSDEQSATPRGHSGMHSDCADNCTAPDGMAECCSNTVLFIAVEDHFIKTDQPLTTADNISVCPVFGNELAFEPAPVRAKKTTSFRDPPPGMYGWNLSLFHRVLIL
ncbi:MAG: hypothetical protein EA408_08580 [Marinilabiliales bacterium]|nr:MAG: hypothetical protein EA408_08580 [Marinilabiliales bacterium]